jgi:hypothetical protein
MVDRQYCCAEHRAQARLASTIVREEEEEQELWSVTRSREKARNVTNANKPISIYGVLSLTALLLALFMLPGGGGSAPSTVFPPVTPDGANGKQGLFSRIGGSVGQMIRSQAPVTLHSDFRNSALEWTQMAMAQVAGAGSVSSGAIPSSASMPSIPTLRLWNKSTLLRNYEMDFQGQIENRSLGWAFRATDAGNYYAAKLVINRNGSSSNAGPNAGLIHYVMLNGRESDRVSLPLPVSLQRGVDYRVRVSVDGDRFLTYLNGQVISSWRDQRLSRGGVGFIDDAEDPQRISWVNLSERDSFLGRMLANFSFMLPALPR